MRTQIQWYEEIHIYQYEDTYIVVLRTHIVVWTHIYSRYRVLLNDTVRIYIT